MTIPSRLDLPKDGICPRTAHLYTALLPVKLHSRAEKHTGASGSFQSLAEVSHLLLGRLILWRPLPTRSSQPRQRCWAIPVQKGTGLATTESGHRGQAAGWANEAVGSFPTAAGGAWAPAKPPLQLEAAGGLFARLGTESEEQTGIERATAGAWPRSPRGQGTLVWRFTTPLPTLGCPYKARCEPRHSQSAITTKSHWNKPQWKYYWHPRYIKDQF